MTERHLRIAVLGGGIGGLACALALRQHGFAPLVYERAAAIEDVGAGISLSPNAVHALFSMGLRERIEAVAAEPLEQLLCHGFTGEVLHVIDRRRTREVYGAPYLQMHRGDLVAVLRDAVGDAAIRLDHEVVAIVPAGPCTRVAFANATDVTADVVIAADGLRSLARASLFAGDAPVFSQHVAWRALIPARDLPDRASAPININHLGKGRNIVCYPVRGGTLVNIVALTGSAAWAEESWSARASKTDLAQEFAGWAPLVQALIAAIPEDALFRWGLLLREPLRDWVAGRTVLLGDAAHPMLPYMGQGASSAIEDGIILARCLAAGDDPDEALRRYSATRVPRAGRLQAESNLGGERLHAIDPDAFGAVPLKDEDALGIFAYDPVNAPLAD